MPLTQAPARQSLPVVQGSPEGVPHLPPVQMLEVHCEAAVQFVSLGSVGTQVLLEPQ